MSKVKIQIKSIFGSVLFEWEKEENTIRETILEAIKRHANLRRANLSGANLIGANLSGADLRCADLSDANLIGANLSGADLIGANLRRANLGDANLSDADLSDADLIGANLGDANLSDADLRRADLSDANLRRADLSDANLSDANLSGADLSDADLSDADLIGANLSGAENIFNPIRYLKENFKYSNEGLIAYKKIGLQYSPKKTWGIKEGAVLEENPNPCVTSLCCCGVNVATLKWLQGETGSNSMVWKCLIRWEWLVGVVVPWGTDGKIRCYKVELVEEKELQEWVKIQKQETA